MKRSWLKVSWTGKIMLLINVIFAAALLASQMATLIPADQLWPLVFAGLSFPLFLFVNAVFVVFWILRSKVFFLLSLIVILFNAHHISSIFQWNPGQQDKEPAESTSLSVLSYNVRVFDLYNYRPGWKPDFTNRNNIFRFLQQKDFDIICFQEFVHDRSGVFKTLDTIPGLIRAHHAHFEYTREAKNTNFFGLATFSAYPIVHTGRIAFPSKGGNLCIYSDIKIAQDTIRVYNVHFESIGLSPEDYVFVEGILSDREQDVLGEGSRRILDRIKVAAQKRALQARQVAEHVAQSPYPVILAGDFNDTPVSYVYRQMNLHLTDAFGKGHGIGQTYIGAFPGFRIDYIFHSPAFESLRFFTGNQKYSDHYPVYTTLLFSNPQDEF